MTKSVNGFTLFDKAGKQKGEKGEHNEENAVNVKFISSRNIKFWAVPSLSNNPT